MENTQKHLVIVDGFSFLFRAFHAVRGNLTREDGTPTNALYGFAQMLTKVVNDLQPNLCAVALDSPAKTFRDEIYPDYKAHRPDMDDAMKAQMPFFEPMIESFGIPAIRFDGFEADDIIATLAKDYAKQGFRVTIVSSDKDLMQLIDDNISMLDTMKNRTMSYDAVAEKFGITPDKVIEVQALIGDSSDNVPGVRSVGPKTAAQLIDAYGDLEGIYANLAEIKREKLRDALTEHKENAFLSRQLVTLATNVPLTITKQELEFHPDLSDAAHFLRETLEFNSLADRLEKTAEPSKRVTTPSQNFSIYAKKPAGIPVETPKLSTYTTVSTPEILQKWIDKIKSTGFVAFDTETTGLDALRADLVGFSLAVSPHEACYVPVNHKDPEADGFFSDGGVQQIEMQQALELLKPVLQDPQIKIIGQNLKYDWLVMAKAYGLLESFLNNNTDHKRLAETGFFELFQNYEDTLLMSFCLDAGRHPHNMDALALKHLNKNLIAFKEVCGTGKKQITFDYVPLDKATDYAAEDADVTLQLYQLFNQRLQEPQVFEIKKIYETIERPLLPILAAMEWRGVSIDKGELSKLSQEFQTQITACESQIHTLAGAPFNVNSPKQLGEILFDKLELSVGRNKKRSTNVDVLEKLAEEGHDIAKNVLTFRQLSKLKSTYTDALIEQVNPLTQRIHTSYNQAGASTGRFSSSDPNLQNIPSRTENGRKIRNAFITQQDWVMVSADYSQIELRILAHMSESPTLLDAFQNGADIHSVTAQQIFETQDITSDQRRVAKIINFGIVYGMGAVNLSKQIDVSRKEAATYIENYFARYTGVKEFMESNKDFAREHGYVQTLLGRRIHLNDIDSTNPGFRAGAERAAINAPLQGSNADIIKKVMPEIETALREQGFQARMLMQVHDELIFEMPKNEQEPAVKLITQLMEQTVSLKVPLSVGVGFGNTWEAAH